jgi:hypothetical protein
MRQLQAFSVEAEQHATHRTQLAKEVHDLFNRRGALHDLD